MGETLHALGIEWPKLIAQTINFAIVLFVLWKWAYQPVLKMLELRREKVAESITNADKIKAELAATEARRQEILNQARDQAGKLIEEARAAAARVQAQETQRAVAQAEQIVAKAQEATAQDHARMLMELKREVGRLVVQTTAAVTGKVLTPDDQRRLIEEANRQLTA
ncbi:MAG TPA: F0F1 ATP synthase subunit B [Verrucomicrobiota bacterium]|jgi:F-type H+-transporting ATPase subunit b|nr:F0F1 ATP synthase subunit B [Verrucomicrobiota bacterium]OQB88762.1 MAG: ATP synthase subunit b [Verrucomicrobia bacterium ADurb.Bin118]HPY30581.1 F0F1 ATP synthase subunit B [Verrucomicrobiota bacterium]HQB17008.1 F0F1 ATP synthase subunit B [Verrucomicrobiota bacterium]